MSAPLYTIAYDTELMRPGCAIVQATLGAILPNEELMRMEPHTWLLSPTNAMRVYPIDTQEQIDYLVTVTNATNPKKVRS